MKVIRIEKSESTYQQRDIRHHQHVVLAAAGRQLRVPLQRVLRHRRQRAVVIEHHLVVHHPLAVHVRSDLLHAQLRLGPGDEGCRIGDVVQIDLDVHLHGRILPQIVDFAILGEDQLPAEDRCVRLQNVQHNGDDDHQQAAGLEQEHACKRWQCALDGSRVLGVTNGAIMIAICVDWHLLIDYIAPTRHFDNNYNARTRAT